MTKRTAALLVLLAGLALTGCRREDPRLKNLEVGIPKDSALAVLGVRAGERPASYLINGQFIEAMMIRREGVEGPLDSLSRKEYTPIVTLNGNLSGWGWKYWDSLASANKITP